MNKPQIRQLHAWDLSPAEAREVQRRLAPSVSRRDEIGIPRLVAGVDVSYRHLDDTGLAAVVVLEYPTLKTVEVKTRQGKAAFPYIPGLLSYREVPLVLEIWQDLMLKPDLVMVDGQGIAHPRRLGLASHLGLVLDIPTIGCAKSVLCGHHGPVGEEAGSWAELVDKEEVVGAALRTKKRTTPIYVSIGHKVDLPVAIRWTLECCRGYRLPEPTRLAHLASTRRLPEPNGAAAAGA
ncbi:MAG: deoxyribonuclease V [Chloroflexi bacterium]|nr:deoxyribonuclease V [Chloroflexota bacterium]